MKEKKVNPLQQIIGRKGRKPRILLIAVVIDCARLRGAIKRIKRIYKTILRKKIDVYYASWTGNDL